MPILLLFTKHYKNRYFSTFFKANNYKINAFLEVIIWSKLGAFKKRQLGPDNNFQNSVREFFFQKYVLNPLFL